MEFTDNVDSNVSSKYECKGKLGEGAFGEVRIGVDTTTGRDVALKYVRVLTKQKGIPRAVFRELESLRHLGKSRFVVDLLDVFPDDTNLCLVLEYLPSDLGEVIAQAPSLLPVSHVKAYALMLLEALGFCHSQSIIHRDIKPSSKR